MEKKSKFMDQSANNQKMNREQKPRNEKFNNQFSEDMKYWKKNK